jgi:hypothetical protein
MSLDTVSLEDLERHVRALTAPQGPAELFKNLLEAIRLVAPRGSVYVIRKDEVRGWGAVGFPEDASRALRSRSAGLTDGWIGRVLGSELPIYEPDAEGVCPGYGQPPPGECVGLAIRVKERPIAMVVVERQAHEQPWQPPLLSVVARVAQLQLELDVLRRRVGAPEPAPAPPAVAEHSARPSPRSPSAPRELSLDDPNLEAARRFARLVATDIRLYNEEAVLLGRRQRDLTDRLADQLTRGKEAFLKRHGTLGRTALEVLRAAYVEVLAGGDETLLPGID